jgi:hypothetical protein
MSHRKTPTKSWLAGSSGTLKFCKYSAFCGCMKEGKATMGTYNHFMTIQEMIDLVAFFKQRLGKR